MRKNHNNELRRARGFFVPLLVLCLGVGITGCDSLLNVDNPNNVVGEDLLLPSAQKGVVNGALYTVQAGYAYIMTPYSTVSDELTWVGSRDAWLEIEVGGIDNALNEYIDGAFKYFGPGRWMADEAIRIMEMHRDSGVVNDFTDLARAYFYGAQVYRTAADMFEDMTLSDRKISGAPLGPAGMGAMYTTALEYIDAGLAVIAAEGSTAPDLKRNLLAQRAKTRHSIGMRAMLYPAPVTVSANLVDMLVQDAEMVQNAQDALALDNSDWVQEYEYEQYSGTVLQYSINSRLELRFSDVYVQAVGLIRDADTTNAATGLRNGIVLLDPIDGMGDPRLDEFMTYFEAGGRNAELTLNSMRELRLLIAEDALARGDNGTFTQQINLVRDESPVALTHWTSGGPGMPSAVDMLIHERQVNLFLQGIRLHDMYRFGIRSPAWQSTRVTYTTPGTLFPLPKVELDANCHLNPDFPCEG